MARNQKLSIDRKILREMTGLTDDINAGREPVDPFTWVIQRCHVSMQTVRRYLRGLNGRGNQPTNGAQQDLLWDFQVTFNELQAVCARRPIKAIQDISDDSNHSKRLDASKYLAERIFPERWGKPAEQVEVTVGQAAEGSLSDVPQIVFDSLTDEEFGLIETLQAEIDERRTSIKTVLASAQERAELTERY